MIYDSLTELIGGTPILRVKPLEGQVAEILVLANNQASGSVIFRN